ncbi:transcriptional regulator [Labrys miyagiensis]|uniref:Transcriptional regulator n=1 Tax=Labrys miyagiensis TaxID=346912 RepID=A0ABQ6CJF9_9HYPH|nr:LysR substrate-binding domain-containing protein [Labrys miyagiensis]GLS20386.1 transcriptional regulator [Labrys miyagiensis]
MALPDIEIDLLRAFVAVAEAGSMTGGAEIVGRTQSAVSQKIIRLEDLIGRRVFERSSRSLSLTDDGERLLGAARRMIEFNDETMRQFISPSVSGQLRLGVTEDFIPQQLPRLLARFARTYPDVTLELTTGMSCGLLALLDKGELDLALAKKDGAMQRGRIIWREPLEWIAAESFEIPADKPVPLVLLPHPCSYRGLALDTLEAAGRSSTISCTASSLTGVQAAVAGGLGITLLGRSFLQPGLRVFAASEGWPPLPMTEIVLLGEERAQDHLAKALVSFLTESLTRSTLQIAA